MARISAQAATAADNIRADLNAAAERARADGTLSPVGRQQKIAAAYVDAKRRMDALSANVQDGAAVTSASLQKQLFGTAGVTGADAVSVRDAAARAAQLESADEGLQLLRSAEVNGDEQLARAIASRAFAEARSPFGGSWSQVVDEYAASRPGVGRKMEELAAAQRNHAADAVTNAFATAVPKPSEIDAFADHQLEALAQGNGTSQ